MHRTVARTRTRCHRTPVRARRHLGGCPGDVVRAAPEACTGHPERRRDSPCRDPATVQRPANGHTLGLSLSRRARVLPGMITVADWHGCHLGFRHYPRATFASNLQSQQRGPPIRYRFDWFASLGVSRGARLGFCVEVRSLGRRTSRASDMVSRKPTCRVALIGLE